jgi:hypothetical protein
MREGKSKRKQGHQRAQKRTLEGGREERKEPRNREKKETKK